MSAVDGGEDVVELGAQRQELLARSVSGDVEVVDLGGHVGQGLLGLGLGLLAGGIDDLVDLGLGLGHQRERLVLGRGELLARLVGVLLGLGAGGFGVGVGLGAHGGGLDLGVGGE